MWPPAWGWMNAIFVSKANVFESELLPRPFQPSLSHPSCVSFANYRLPYWNAELQNTPADLGACQAHGEMVMGPVWTLQGGRTWVPCQGAASFSSLLMNSSFELYVHREKTDCVLSTGCSYLHPFTPIESNIVTLASFILSGQWSRATGENAAPLVLLLVWFIIASFSPNCQRAACANPKEPVVITRDWEDRLGSLLHWPSIWELVDLISFSKGPGSEFEVLAGEKSLIQASTLKYCTCLPRAGCP